MWKSSTRDRIRWRGGWRPDPGGGWRLAAGDWLKLDAQRASIETDDGAVVKTCGDGAIHGIEGLHESSPMRPGD